jgi:hypothetical protein
METRFVKGLVNLMTGFIIGMMVMAGFYCNALNITSGAMYMGWDTITIVCLSLLAVHVMIHFDPSFKTKEELDKAMGRKHIRMTTKPSKSFDDYDTYDEYGVNTKNSFNTPPKSN